MIKLATDKSSASSAVEELISSQDAGASVTKVPGSVEQGKDIPTPERDEKNDAEAEEEKSSEATEGEAPLVEVSVDVEALKSDFEMPFSITLHPAKRAKRGDLLKSIVSAYDTIKMDDGQRETKARECFRRWACRTLNMAESAFSSPESLREEVAKVESSLIALGKDGGEPQSSSIGARLTFSTPDGDVASFDQDSNPREHLNHDEGDLLQRPVSDDDEV